MVILRNGINGSQEFMIRLRGARAVILYPQNHNREDG